MGPTTGSSSGSTARVSGTETTSLEKPAGMTKHILPQTNGPTTTVPDIYKKSNQVVFFK
jgi:hypothetical protein